MSVELVESLEHLLRGVFHGVGLASALSEIKTCQQFPEYLAGIRAAVRSGDVESDVLVWSIRRGSLWEPIV